MKIHVFENIIKNVEDSFRFSILFPDRLCLYIISLYYRDEQNS